MNAIKQPRYEYRFCNGYHAVFDTVRYCPVELFRTEKEAREKLNG